MGLLHGDDLVDVIDVRPQRLELGQRTVLLGGDVPREGGEESRQLLTLRTGEERGKIIPMLLEKCGHPREVRAATATDFLGGLRRGNVHAIEHVADIVQHARGDLRHARFAGNLHLLPMRLREVELCRLARGDFPDQVGVLARHLALEIGQLVVRPRHLFVERIVVAGRRGQGWIGSERIHPARD